MSVYSTQLFTLKSSGATTGSSQSSYFDVQGYLEGIVYLDITASGGTSPTLDVVVETTPDDGGTQTAFTHTSFAQKTGTGQDTKAITNFGKWLRVKWTVGGTSPTFTFRVILIAKG